MKVIEIFDSIDGEGIRTGQCATFIRLAGCNLRCSYCDTVYSLFGEETPCEYTEMTVDEIISKVNMTYKRVTLTGGEPLVHTDSAELVSKLTEIGCDVNIETNGAVDIVDFLSKVPKSDNLFFTIDYKLPSSAYSLFYLFVIKFFFHLNTSFFRIPDNLVKLNLKCCVTKHRLFKHYIDKFLCVIHSVNRTEINMRHFGINLF